MRALLLLTFSLSSEAALGAEVQLKKATEVHGTYLSPKFTEYVTFEPTEPKPVSVAQLKDLKTGKTIRTVNCDTEWGPPALLSPDGKTYVALAQSGSGSHYYKARVFRLADNEPIAHLGSVGSLTIAAEKLLYSPDGKSLALCGTPKPGDDPGLWLWDIEGNKGRKLLPDRIDHRFHPPHLLTFAPDGKSLALGENLTRYRGIWVVDVATGKELLNINRVSSHADPKVDAAVECIRFAPDGKTIATAASDRMVKLWDVATGKEVAKIEHLDGVKAVAFHPNGRVLASLADDRKLRLWDIKKQRVLATTEKVERGGSGEHASLQFSQDGKQIALMRYPQWFPTYRANITIWDVVGEVPKD